MSKARVFAAKHDWQAARPDPQSPVIQIQTSASVGKTVAVSAATLGFGGLFMHPKAGQLLFEQQPSGCKISSKGDPAEKVLSELKKGPVETADAGPVKQGAVETSGQVIKDGSTKSVTLGQTPDQVEATLGKPDKIVDLGQKKVYVYKDLKIVFVDDKVADVQ